MIENIIRDLTPSQNAPPLSSFQECVGPVLLHQLQRTKTMLPYFMETCYLGEVLYIIYIEKVCVLNPSICNQTKSKSFYCTMFIMINIALCDK